MSQKGFLQIVSFANYDIAEAEELIPEQSNCGKRKPINYDPLLHKASQFQRNEPIGLDLQNCELIHLVGIKKLVDVAFFYPQNVTYLDVRCNKLTKLDGILELPQLKTLYMQGNQIDTVDKLAPLQQLQLSSLATQGNPFTRQKGYKSYIINLLPTLIRLDTSGITFKDRQEAEYNNKMGFISLQVQDFVEMGNLQK